MPRKLQDDEDTVTLQIKLPAHLKRLVQVVAHADGDGDLSSWVRTLLRREVERYLERHPDYLAYEQRRKEVERLAIREALKHGPLKPPPPAKKR